MAQKTLDEVLEELKQIGVKDISKTTRLTISRVEDILNKRFEKIDKVRAQGFIHILEREYSVDLSEWIKLYGRFHNQEPLDFPLDSKTTLDAQQTEQQIQKAKQNEVIDEIDIKKKVAKAQKGKPIQKVQTNIESLKLPERESKDGYYLNNEPKKYASTIFLGLLVLAIIVIVCVLGYKIFFQHSQEYKFTTDKKEQVAQNWQNGQGESPLDSERDVAHEQDSTNQTYGAFGLSDFNGYSDPITSRYETVPHTPNEQDSNTQNATPNEPQNQINNEQSSPQAHRDSQSLNVANLNDRLNDTNTAQESQTTQSNTLESSTQNIATIHPGSAVWVGIVDLETKASSQMTLYKAQNFTLDKPMVFVFGHNDFKLTYKGQSVAYKTRQFVRLYFDGNEIKEINYTTYKQLNPVERW